MNTLIYIFVFLGLYHFFYEAIVAKTLRHTLRYKYFALRDELRFLNISGQLKAEDQELYILLDKSLCNVINRLSYINLANYFFVYRRLIKSDRNFQNNQNKMRALLENTTNEKLLDLENRISKLSGNALCINNGGWLLYLIPIGILFIIFALIFEQFKSFKNAFRNIGDRLVYNSSKIKPIKDPALV